MQAILDRVKMSSSYNELHAIIKKQWKELKKDATHTGVQELLVGEGEQVEIKKKPRPITAMLSQPTGRHSRPQKDILSTQTSLWTDSTPLIQFSQADTSKLVHSKDILLVVKLMMISSESDMFYSTPLIDVLMQDVLNSDADYMKNTPMSEMNLTTEQESEESAISSRTRAQIYNSIIENAKTVSDKGKHGCNVIKAPSAPLSLLKSDSQLI